MENLNHKFIKLFLRLAIAAGFLSAVADRFGMWPREISVWGNWENFIAYTAVLNPWFPESFAPPLAAIATGAEVLFAICLIIGFKTELVAKLSGVLLLVFGISMAFSVGIKAAFDYSVFAAAAGAFALSALKGKDWELDSILASNR